MIRDGFWLAVFLSVTLLITGKGISHTSLGRRLGLSPALIAERDSAPRLAKRESFEMREHFPQ